MGMSTKTIKMVVLGDLAVGKTCLLVTFTTNEFRKQYVPTQFDNYHTRFMVDGREITLDFFDTSGKDDDDLRTVSYEKTDIFMILFAINHRESFRNCKNKWLKEIASITDSITNQPVPFILIGTKSDVKETEKRVTQSDIDEFVQSTSSCIGYQETSSLKDQGINECIERAVRHVLRSGDNGGCGCVLL